MKVRDDHMYHGAALIQVAEHPRFTAINSLKIDGEVLRNAYRINDDIGLYLKYCTSPAKPFNEYVFTFHSDHLTIVLHFWHEWFDIVVIFLKIIGVPAIDGLATNWGRNADAQAESATAVSN